MSALVGYESSSEEDEPDKAKADTVAESAEKTFNANTATNEQNGHFANAEEEQPGSHQTTDRPIVGPTMPEQDGYEMPVNGKSTPGFQQTMSERDAVRLLTQTSHPMTSMPPSPPGSPDAALGSRFKRFLDLKAKAVHFNDDLARKSTFRNPSFLSTMMDRVGLDETDQYKTSLPRELWDPVSFPPFAYKEELLRSQQAIREHDSATKKSLSASGKRTIEFTPGGNSGWHPPFAATATYILRADIPISKQPLWHDSPFSADEKWVPAAYAVIVKVGYDQGHVWNATALQDRVARPAKTTIGRRQRGSTPKPNLDL